MPKLINPYKLYNATETAKVIGLTPLSVWRLLKSKKLKGNKIGKYYWILGQDILDYYKIVYPAELVSYFKKISL